MDDAPVKPGDMLAGKYRVERVLGIGSMGVVVAAMHEALGRRVAVKFMTIGGPRAREFEARFGLEARAAARLQSQHAAKVLDFGTLESGAPYIVMEYLEGRDLAAILRECGPLGVGEAVTLILQACDALAEAHAAGIVHRDVKPANLFLTRSTDGSPCLKLVDFGVAKLRDGGLELTGAAATLGSPLYMSPEVMEGRSRDVDGRADIWSLGVSFYEMLAGVSPFQRETFENLMKAIFLNPPPPLTNYRSDVPPGLWAVLEKTLEKKCDQRFSTVSALAAALAPYAPPQALPYVERIAKVQGTDLALARPRDLLPSEPAVGPPPASGPATRAVSAKTQPEPVGTAEGAIPRTARRGASMPVAIGLIAFSVAGAALLFWSRWPAIAGPTGKTTPTVSETVRVAEVPVVPVPTATEATTSAVAPATTSIATATAAPSMRAPPLPATATKVRVVPGVDVDNPWRSKAPRR